MSKKESGTGIVRRDFNTINEAFSENALKMMRKRYLQRKSDGSQETPAEMFARIAHALAEVERRYGRDQSFIDRVEEDFFDIMTKKEYTPAGRSVTNLGAETAVVANCIVLPILDSMESIFQTLKDAALLQQAGSGLGFDFSHLRPAMTRTNRSNGVASGPVSFLKVYNEAFGVIKQQGRHGANMAMMQVDHPDILDFIRCKEVEGSIRNFNISIKVTDEFMRQVVEAPDTQWYCNWKGEKMKPHRVLRAPNGSVTGVEELEVTARQIFDELVHYAWLNGEPGIVFIDEVNRTNPLPGLGPIDCSNPCGEQFLHHYDNCNLGSINLAVFVKNGKFDWNRLKEVSRIATRMMDNVIDTFDFPVKQVTELAQKNRRIGLGIMGLADALYQMEIPYDSEEGRAIAQRMMKTVTDASHAMSRELAAEKGEFANTPLSIYAGKKFKMRNAALTTIAPTGSIAMMFDTSSGVEPNFALSFVKQDKDGIQYHYFNRHFAESLKKYRIPEDKVDEIKKEILETGSIQRLTDLPEKLRRTFVVAMDISAEAHMKMQSAMQQHVDNSISKTINFPNSATHEEVANGYITAWQTKCKSATVYRDGSRTVQVLNIGSGENVKKISDLGVDGKLGGQSSAPQTVQQVLSNASVAPAEEQLNLGIDEGKLKPRVRPDIMTGKTYKVKTGYGNLYVTVNNDGGGEPFEVFATLGKSGGFFQEQCEAICRLVSLALRTGVKVEQVVSDLKGIRGPMPVMTSRGTILSLPDAIGRILEEHAKTIDEEVTQKIEEPVTVSLGDKEILGHRPSVTASLADFGHAPGCPDCGSMLVMAEGCMSCKNCGFSRCM